MKKPLTQMGIVPFIRREAIRERFRAICFPLTAAKKEQKQSYCKAIDDIWKEIVKTLIPQKSKTKRGKIK